MRPGHRVSRPLSSLIDGATANNATPPQISSSPPTVSLGTCDPERKGRESKARGRQQRSAAAAAGGGGKRAPQVAKSTTRRRMTRGNSHLPARHAVGAAALVPIVRSLECVGRAPAQVIKGRREGRYHSPFHPALGLLPPSVQICQMSSSSPSQSPITQIIHSRYSPCRSVDPSGLRSLGSDGGRRQFCRETCSSTSVRVRRRRRRSPVGRPSIPPLPYRAGYVLYLESDLFPPKPPPSLPPPATNIQPEQPPHRQGRRARATDSLTCFLCRSRRLPDSRTDG